MIFWQKANVPINQIFLQFLVITAQFHLKNSRTDFKNTEKKCIIYNRNLNNLINTINK